MAGKSIAARVLKGRPEKLAGNSIDWAIVDELPSLQESMRPEDFRRLYFQEFDMSDKTEVQLALEALVDRMVDHFLTQAEVDLTVSLMSPGSLTVSVPQKGYRKQNHIGGEDFIASGAYVGAANKLIFKFKPVAAAQYTEMEMNEVDAAANLSGFRALANNAAGGDFFAELRNIRNLGQKEKLAQEVVEKAAVYEDFGSW